MVLPHTCRTSLTKPNTPLTSPRPAPLFVVMFDVLRTWQTTIYAFALGWLAAWFVSFISSVLVSIIAVIVLVTTLSMTGALQFTKPAPPPSFHVMQDDEEEFAFEPIDDLVTDDLMSGEQ